MKLATGRIACAKLAGPYRLEGQLISTVLASRHKYRLRFELALYRRRTRYKAAKRMLKTTLVLDRGGTFFFGGGPHKGGKLVIGITCRKGGRSGCAEQGLARVGFCPSFSRWSA